MHTINIAIAEDHAPTLKRLISYFSQQPKYTIGIEAVDGYDLILKMTNAKNLPSIIILDINMPVIDGVCVAFYLNFQFPDVKVIALTIYDNINMVTNIFETGISGYVLKANMESILYDAINSVEAGNIYLDPRIELDEKQLPFVPGKKQAKNATPKNPFGLTAREAIFVMLNATMLTYDQIARIMFVEPKTIQTYFDRVSKKLKVSSRQALTIYSIQNGLSKLAFYS